MGHLCGARCTGCKYSQKLALGSGLANHKTRAWWPVWCEDCGCLGTVNYKADTLECGECDSHNVTRPDNARNWSGEGRGIMDWMLFTPSTELVTQTWLQRLLRQEPKQKYDSERLVLTDGQYRCPQCGDMALKFSSMGFWD